MCTMMNHNRVKAWLVATGWEKYKFKCDKFVVIGAIV